MKVPKPPKKIEIAEDRRLQNLKRWEELFKAISPEIKVYVNPDPDNTPDEFQKVWESLFNEDDRYYNIDASWFYIMVVLPKGMEEEYLLGSPHDRMFSCIEWRKDVEFLQENELRDPLPKSKPWKYWYERISKLQETANTSVPEPPDKNAGT